MTISRRARLALLALTALVLAFIYAPLMVVLVNSFNPSRTSSWPPSGLTMTWWGKALSSAGALSGLTTSLKIAAGATVVALVLGSMAAFAVSRYRFFGRETVSFLVVLPIALPGIVTGLALAATFQNVLGIQLGLLTVIVGHATFCIVVVFNNVLARLRRTGSVLEEASADLGADTFQTFLYVTLPQIRSALLAGGLLAFALSFDEIVVTSFTSGATVQTLPQWIYNNVSRAQQGPVVNVVAAALVVLSVVPVWLAQRISGEQSATGRL